MKRAFDGLSMVAVGVVLLACTTGYLSWAVWVSVFSLWPVLLVSAGIDIIGNSTGREWIRALSSVVFIAALLYGAFVMPAGTWGLPWSSAGAGERFDAREPARSEVTHGTAAIEAGATRLTVGAGGDLAAISGESPAGARPELAVRTSDGAAEVSVTQPRETVVWVGMAPRRRLDVTLDRSVKWDSLDVNAGAADASIDLRELKVGTLDVKAGAADVRVTCGDAPLSGEFQAGAASILVRVPKNARVRLRLTGALDSASVPADFRRVSGIGFIGDTEWTGAGDGPAIELTVRAGVASVFVERY